jgi:hypothetical protein
MGETDLQLGGGYTYQWDCAILLALNYFFEPVRYNPTLFDLVQGFLGRVEEMYLEGKEQQDGVDLEDIGLVGRGRRVLVQVKTKQAEGERWTLTDDLLLKALHKFYDSPLFTKQPDDTRFVFLTNRPFNPDLVRVKDAIKAGALDRCAEADRLCGYLDRYARDNAKSPVDTARLHQVLARTALVEYLAVEEVKANVQAKLQARGCRDWEQVYAVLFEHFARGSTHTGGSTITRASLDRVLVSQGARPDPGAVSVTQVARARDGIAVAGNIHAGRDVIMGNQYNDFRQQVAQITTPAEFVAQLQALQAELAALKQQPGLSSTHVEEVETAEESVQEALAEAHKPQPAAGRIKARLTSAKAVLDSVAESVKSAVGLGAVLAQLIQVVLKLFGS